MKICNKCLIEKEKSSEFFHRKSESKDGFNTICKSCIKESKSKYYSLNKDKINKRNNKWKLDNPERIKKINKEWFIKNREDVLEKKKEYRKDNADKISEKGKEYYHKSKKRRNDRFKERMATDPVFRLKKTIKCLVYDSFRKNNFTKNGRTESIIGVSFLEFKEYIESKFQEGMSWENHGEWHLDHIIPISMAKNEQKVIELNHYSNFQPLWAKDNLKKSNKINE